MNLLSLSPSQVSDILEYLGVPSKAPTLRYLNSLISAYTRRVPWESVSRIVRRRTTRSTAACPRWPEEFWRQALAYGFGGTCFESSLAFYSLVTALGYQGYLTVNDMGETHACHAAVVALFDDRKYLVDVTIPVHRAVRIDPQRVTQGHTPFHNYTIRPDGEHTYQVERSHHPQKNAFTLVDVPVSLTAYQAIVERDYTEHGYFLDRVVIVKVVDGRVWRFNSSEQPYRLESFNRKDKQAYFLSTDTLAWALAEHFRLPDEQILTALSWVHGGNFPPTG
jgi:arylamine N-acetyltransferase